MIHYYEEKTTMKQPLFNQLERRIIKNGNSASASLMTLEIAKKRFERDFTKTSIWRFMQKTIAFLARNL